MAGDERRAEVEAVARAVWNVVGDRMDSWYAPERFREAIAEAAIAVLDRLRDARGDDEGKTLFVRPAGTDDVMAVPLARSPQREDHEAGIEHRHHFNCKASMTGRNDDCDCTPEVWVRVSPSRDGTVAVEDVERLVDALREVDRAISARLPLSDVQDIAREALAEFARSAAGEQTDHGGDQ